MSFTDTPNARAARGHGIGALHRAHIVAVAVHIVCCGLPLVASALSLVAGVGGGVVTFSTKLHAYLHGLELPLLLTSGVLLSVAAVAFVLRYRSLGWGDKLLFAASLVAFLINLGVTVPHLEAAHLHAGLPAFTERLG